MSMDEAMRFWCEINTFPFLRVLYLGQHDRIADKYESFARCDTLRSEFENFVQDKLGYHATLDELASSKEAAQKGRLAFWEGSYVLYDDKDQPHRVDILADSDSSDRVSVSVDEKPVTDYTFADSKLTLKGEVSGVLTFSVPPLPEAGLEAWFAARTSVQQRCVGTLTFGGASHPVAGRLGCITKEGARSEKDCDPLKTWAATYNVVVVEEESGAVSYPPRGLTVAVSGTSVTVGLFDPLTLSSYRYLDNALRWGDESNGGYLQFAEGSGSDRIVNGDIRIDGTVYQISGHFAAPAPMPRRVFGAGTKIVTAPGTLPAVAGQQFAAISLSGSGATTYSNFAFDPSQTNTYGLVISAAGDLSSTAVDASLVPGNYTLTFSAKDPGGTAVTLTATLNVVVPSLTILTTVFPIPASGGSYSAMLSAAGGIDAAALSSYGLSGSSYASNYQGNTWMANGLPDGLSVVQNSDGTFSITGKATTANQATLGAITVSCTVAGNSLSSATLYVPFTVSDTATTAESAGGTVAQGLFGGLGFLVAIAGVVIAGVALRTSQTSEAAYRLVKLDIDAKKTAVDNFLNVTAPAEFQQMRTDIAAFQGQIDTVDAAIKAETKSRKADVNLLTLHATAIEGDVSALRAQISTLDTRIATAVDAAKRTLETEQAKLKKDLETKIEALKKVEEGKKIKEKKAMTENEKGKRTMKTQEVAKALNT